eukprot:scaffold95994_cov20-Tisochrysis_lutea.AAC.2
MVVPCLCMCHRATREHHHLAIPTLTELQALCKNWRGNWQPSLCLKTLPMQAHCHTCLFPLRLGKSTCLYPASLPMHMHQSCHALVRMCIMRAYNPPLDARVPLQATIPITFLERSRNSITFTVPQVSAGQYTVTLRKVRPVLEFSACEQELFCCGINACAVNIYESCQPFGPDALHCSVRSAAAKSLLRTCVLVQGRVQPDLSAVLNDYFVCCKAFTQVQYACPWVGDLKSDWDVLIIPISASTASLLPLRVNGRRPPVFSAWNHLNALIPSILLLTQFNNELSIASSVGAGDFELPVVVSSTTGFIGEWHPA